MNTFIRFFYEFISVFFDGIVMIFGGLFNGIIKMFNFTEYAKVIDSYKDSFNGGEKIFVVLAVILLLLIIAIIITLIVLLIRAILRKLHNNFNKDELLEEIANLNAKVRKLMKEKDELMAMKVSQLGVNPDEEESTDVSEEEEDEGIQGIRFPKLVAIDKKYEGFKVKNYNNDLH